MKCIDHGQQLDDATAAKQGEKIAKLVRWYSPIEVPRMATSGNAELLVLSGDLAPYKGQLGVVVEGALADLLLVGCDPIANIALVADPAKNFLVIMKDGRIHQGSPGAMIEA